VLLGLCGFYVMRGELSVADDVSRQLLAVAEETGDTAALLGGHNAAGLVAFYRGDFVSALRHFEHSKTIYDPDRHGPNRQAEFTFDHDPGVSFGAHQAMALQLLGHPERAAARMAECLAHARALDHPLSLAMAYNFAATMHQIWGDHDVVQELEDVRLEYSRKHDFELFLMLGEIYRGWLLACDGQADEGAELILHGLAVYQAIGAELGRPTFLGIFASVCHQLGRHQDARAAIDTALALGEHTGLRYWDAELHRLKGTIALGEPGRQRRAAEREAKACFVTALDIARKQSARFLELRAATSLARLLYDQGKPRDARAALADVTASFTDGLETADVRGARALLAELDAPARPRR